MNLAEIQREMFEVLREPLTGDERMQSQIRDGRSTLAIADAIIKPNDRLTSFERLEIYNRQYWFRILSAFDDDFPGLKAVVGDQQFEKLSVAYLADCPSRSFTLRNLGSRLERWLQEHLEYIRGVEQLALDMVRLEWAEVEAFDGDERPALKGDDIARLGPDPVLQLQPYVRLLALSYPVDEWLLKVRRHENTSDVVSNAVNERQHTARRRRPARPKPAKTYLAVHRVEHSVYFKRLDPEGYALLTALRNGMRLSEAMENIDWGSRSPEQLAGTIQGWFANWASLGWFPR